MGNPKNFGDANAITKERQFYVDKPTKMSIISYKSLIYGHYRPTIVTSAKCFRAVKMLEVFEKIYFNIIEFKVNIIKFMVAIVAEP